MPAKTTQTRDEIIRAARAEFLARGYEGARLQNIADRIGVTKAMIHYYFNTKEGLFEHVYRQSVDFMFRGLSEVLKKDIPLFKKIETLISACSDKVRTNPEVLGFILAESNRNADWLLPIFEEHSSLEKTPFAEQIEEAASDYIITSVDSDQLLLNIFSLCYYPAVALPINRSLLDGRDGKSAEELVTDREGIVLDTVLNWLTA